MFVLLTLLPSLKNCGKNYFIVNFEHLKHFHMSTTLRCYKEQFCININIIITHLIKGDKKFQKHIASYLSSF